MDEIKDINSQFEGVKVGMRHTKDGHLLTLAIHPNDTPEDIMRDPVGQRYMVVLVRVNDEGEPVASKTTEEGMKAIRIAATLCSDENFQQWLIQIDAIDARDEDQASAWLRQELGVTSRKDLKHNSIARQKLYSLRDEFLIALRSGKLS